jgi:asparagine synthase (glutamine-hydrolysing)
MGFGVPLRAWFGNELREMAYDVLLSSRALARVYFRPETVRRLLDEHTRGAHVWHVQLWTLLMLEFWHHAFIDGGPPADNPASDRTVA